MRLFQGPTAPVGQALERHLLDRLCVGQARAVAELGGGFLAGAGAPAGVEANIVGTVQVVGIAAVAAPFGADGEGVGSAAVAKRACPSQLRAARVQRREAGYE